MIPPRLSFPELHDQLETKLNRPNNFMFAALQYNRHDSILSGIQNRVKWCFVSDVQLEH